MNALRWISFATRPLFIEEVIEVCAIDLDSDPEFDPAERYNPTNILDIVPGLLTIIPAIKTSAEPVKHGKHCVIFAHSSVQEYLRGTSIIQSTAEFYSLEFVYSNHFIAQPCLAYLLCCNTLELRDDGYSLRGYAWEYWAWHAVQNLDISYQEMSTQAELLFNQVMQQTCEISSSTLEKLLKQRVHEKDWQELSSWRKRGSELAFRVPFFFEEFDVGMWNQPASSDTSPSIRYNFKPLRPDRSAFRLIELFPSFMNFTEVRCRIFETSLESNPIYDRVSYYWGGVREGVSTRANGLLVKVPKTLVADMRNLGGKGIVDHRILFIDTLGFDRANNMESHMRFHLIPRIFEKSQQVAIGLGEKDAADADAIELVERVATSLGPAESTGKGPSRQTHIS